MAVTRWDCGGQGEFNGAVGKSEETLVDGTAMMEIDIFLFITSCPLDDRQDGGSLGFMNLFEEKLRLFAKGMKK